MTLEAFGELVATVDPKARRYYSAERGAFTTWQEYERIAAFADGRNEGGWRVQLERYAQEENDPIAAALYEMLQSHDNIAVQYMVDTEDTGEATTIRHLFDCEVW